MTKPQQARFDALYARHLRALKLQGKSQKIKRRLGLLTFRRLFGHICQISSRITRLVVGEALFAKGLLTWGLVWAKLMRQRSDGSETGLARAADEAAGSG